MLLAEFQLPPFIDLHLRWFVAAIIIVVGLAVAGAADLARLSWTRIWAISGVCFQESIRRRVLWITPLAILGVIIAVQLLQPLDVQDAVHETVKYALFTTGTLVFITTIILACTNLPKEIDNRVIFTIVTKPTTRLEIVLGKIIGFARVSAALLLIMGVFTFTYAWLRAAKFKSESKTQLETLPPNDAARPSLEHYVKYGLLESNTYVEPKTFEQYAQIPNGTDRFRWTLGNEDQAFVVGFDLPAEMFPEPGTDEKGTGALVIQGRIPYRLVGGKEAGEWIPAPFVHGIPDPLQFGNFNPKGKAMQAAGVTFDVLGPDHFNLVPPTEMNVMVQLPTLRSETDPLAAPFKDLTQINAKSLERLYQYPQERRRIYVRIVGSGRYEFGSAPGVLRLYSERLKQVIEPLKGPDGKPQWPEYRGREVFGGQQIRAGTKFDDAPVGVFEFRGVDVPSGTGVVPAELRMGIEGSGDETSGRESPTTVEISVYNHATNKVSATSWYPIESNRTVFMSFSPDAVKGGNFDVRFRCAGPGHYLVLHGGAMKISIGSESFAWNLFKSLLVMWLMSLLVVIVAIFCSTFVSWPIAVVLTVVILMLHWGAMQLSDTNTPGIGASVARDMGLREPGTAKVVSEAVERLTKLLNTVAKVTPDISQFSATEDIERGMTMTPRVLKESGKVLLAFGLPLTVLAYLFLKRKEVAP
jgi:ABC-type transport system involved in multi-copper enzyme maturation permease subunit